MATTEQRRTETIAALRAKLEAMGHQWTEQERYGGKVFSVDGIVEPFAVKEQRTGYSPYSSEPNGKLYISVGDYGNMRTFPEPKAGFDIDKIAAVVSVNVQRRSTERVTFTATFDRLQANRKIADKLNASAGTDREMAICVTADPKDGALEFVCRIHDVTEAEAGMLLRDVSAILRRVRGGE